jgi:isocitrate dehydrogenase
VQAAKAPIQWEHHTISTHAVTASGDLISQEALDSVIRNKVGLKGPFATPIGGGHRSLNLTLRKVRRARVSTPLCAQCVRALVGARSAHPGCAVALIPPGGLVRSHLARCLSLLPGA